MNGSLAVAVAALFVWLGMVLAISFVEAPLKFRAPGITVQLGLGIGRLVFRALNACELALAATVVLALLLGRSAGGAVVGAAVAVVALAIQLAVVRPALARRSDAVLADGGVASVGRSRAHYVYVGFEGIKVVALLVSGILLLT